MPNELRNFLALSYDELEEPDQGFEDANQVHDAERRLQSERMGKSAQCQIVRPFEVRPSRPGRAKRYVIGWRH